jgi:hypothetical protein
VPDVVYGPLHVVACLARLARVIGRFGKGKKETRAQTDTKDIESSRLMVWTARLAN